MLKFNNRNIESGFIKQLLSTFNLPTCKILDSSDDYILNNQLVNEYIDKNTNTFNILAKNKVGEKIGYNSLYNYSFGTYIQNITKKLNITNTYYDTHTHEYLGEYLRYLRDYKDLDLMPLYNCFSDRVANNINVKFNNSYFNSNDKINYIYCIPVKFGKRYTFVTNSSTVIDFAYGFYDNDKLISVNKNTTAKKLYFLKRLNKVTFDKPEVIEIPSIADFISGTELFNEFKETLVLSNPRITDIEVQKIILQYEPCLKLFVKLNKHIESSIVLLEGDYSNSNVSILSNENQDNDCDIKMAMNLSLLKDTRQLHPYSDKLIEYLTGNVITKDDIISDNIQLVQELLKKHRPSYRIGYKGIWDDSIDTELANQLYNSNTQIEDYLGYVDKDVESFLYKDIEFNEDYTIRVNE